MKNFLKKIIFTIIAIFSISAGSIVSSADPSAYLLGTPKGSITLSTVETEETNDGNSVVNKDGFIEMLKFVQDILLKIVLPVVAVGVALYIAYELLTAEWDSAKMSRAWKAITYGIIAVACILLSYSVVSLISNLKF